VVHAPPRQLIKYAENPLKKYKDIVNPRVQWFASERLAGTGRDSCSVVSSQAAVSAAN
jgi:hypothetical protein